MGTHARLNKNPADLDHNQCLKPLDELKSIARPQPVDPSTVMCPQSQGLSLQLCSQHMIERQYITDLCPLDRRVPSASVVYITTIYVQVPLADLTNHKPGGLTVRCALRVSMD